MSETSNPGVTGMRVLKAPCWVVYSYDWDAEVHCKTRAEALDWQDGDDVPALADHLCAEVQCETCNDQVHMPTKDGQPVLDHDWRRVGDAFYCSEADCLRAGLAEEERLEAVG